MKKLLLLTCVLILSFGGTLFAQEAQLPVPAQETQDGVFKIYKEMPWSLGANFEFNQNTRKNSASGYGISIDRYVGTPLIAMGLRGNMHTDNQTVTATEVLFNVRAYIPIVNSASINTSAFAQLGLGGSFYSEEGRERDTYTMDVLAGCRIFFNRGFALGFLRGFYVEPYIRTGFPVLFSMGLAAGHWFNF